MGRGEACLGLDSPAKAAEHSPRPYGPGFQWFYFLSSILHSREGRAEVLQSPAELPTRSHLFPATPCAGFLWGGGGEGLPFLRLYFYPAPRGFSTPCLQKLKFKTSWGKLPREVGGEMPRRFPRRRPGFHRAPSGSADSHEPRVGRRLLDQLWLPLGLSRLLPEEPWEILLGLSWKCDALRKALG